MLSLKKVNVFFLNCFKSTHIACAIKRSQNHNSQQEGEKETAKGAAAAGKTGDGGLGGQRQL